MTKEQRKKAIIHSHIQLLEQLIEKAEGGGKIYIPNGRINFQSGLGKEGKSPAFGSVVMKLQDKWEVEFIEKTIQDNK